jgi:hypothetical protein
MPIADQHREDCRGDSVADKPAINEKIEKGVLLFFFRTRASVEITSSRGSFFGDLIGFASFFRTV